MISRRLLTDPLISDLLRGLLTALCLWTIGCAEPGKIREYVVEHENKRGLSSEVLRDQYAPVPFRCEVPDSWSIAANDQFSERAWSVGQPRSRARITLGKFPAASGIPAQVFRWRRQLDLETIDVEAAMKDVKLIKTRNQTGSFVAIEGERETIRALILSIESDFWILRYRSSLATAKKEADAFRSFCQSIEYVEMKLGSKSDDGSSADSTSGAEGQ